MLVRWVLSAPGVAIGLVSIKVRFLLVSVFAACKVLL